MFIDLHAHTSGISTCCRVPAPEIIRAARETGVDGIVLSNHYQKSYVKDGDFGAFAKRYTDEYYYTKECGDAVGFRVFELPLSELYPLVKENGGMLVQAHPFRGGRNMLQDLAYLDGVEANSHPLYDATHVVRLTEIAQSAGLILTSGGDYHADTHRPHCGAYLPDSIRDTKDLCAYLLSTDSIDLQIQEPGEMQSRRVTYHRTRIK